MSARKRKARKARKLRGPELRWKCPAEWIPKARTSGRGEDPVPGLVGQERALDAIEMGLAVDAPGYNLFVSGIGGTERIETVRKILDRVRMVRTVVHDHVFVHNFNDPLRPQHLALPAGRGPELRQAMEDWTGTLRREVSRILESEAHLARRKKLTDRYRKAESELFQRFDRRARKAGLTLAQEITEEGSRYDIYLLVEDEGVALDEGPRLVKEGKLSEEELESRAQSRETLRDGLGKTLRQARALGLRLIRESQTQDQEVVRELVEDVTLDLANEIGADEALGSYLGDAARYALSNLSLFRRASSMHEDGGGDEDEEESRPRRRPGLEVFEVNVVRTTEENVRPAVYELHPSYSNLFGTVERHVMSAGSGHYHLAVRPGALLEADGGFLVLNARDVFKEAEVWRALKRTLQNGQLEMHALEALSPLGVTGVRPGPIPLNLKVVLIGDNSLYERLHESDFDFSMIFKVKAEFDDSLLLTKGHVERFVRVIRDLARREQLLPFSNTGLQALVERAVRDSGRRNRLSARLSVLSDYARESCFYARKAGKRRVDRAAVDHAQRQFKTQHSLDVEWSNRMILENVYEIDTSGDHIGIINALTVISLGPLSFGRPARISAIVNPGEESYTFIEREVDLSGPIHTKGALMLESFFRNRFGRKRNLPMRASVVFDQNYGPIDGDSASSTEIYVLLSAIGQFPIKQGIAVTGAVSMRGEVQAVGGVCAKVEGFFELCSSRGLTGEQGVILPEANSDDLMLSPEIVDAVRGGRFHIWTVDSIDQGIELLSGLPAGRPNRSGKYPKDTVMGRVQARLEEFERLQKDEGGDKPESAPEGKDKERGSKPRS